MSQDYDAYRHCLLCERRCGIDRSLKAGYCGMTDEIYAARAALHMWEEGPISGTKGSGAVFFSGCSLRCIFCQNRNIAIGKTGKLISQDRLVEIYLELQEKGAHNINLVTGTHFIPSIVQSLKTAKKKGLSIPIVYNTGNYETEDALGMLDGLVDIYLPDVKYYSEDLSAQFSNSKDYFKIAMRNVKIMLDQVGKTKFDENSIMKSGLIVRHLVLPGHTNDSKALIKSLYDEFGDDIYISIMSQYTPLLSFKDHKELSRKLTDREYDRVLDYALELGLNNAFVQEGHVASESFIPEFDYEGL